MGLDRTVSGLKASLRRSVSRLSRSNEDRLPQASSGDWQSATTGYDARLAAERHFFGSDPGSHQLPDIYDYWSNKFLRPALESLGFSSPNAVFLHYLKEAYCRRRDGSRRFVSIGTGDCATEIDIVDSLLKAGLDDFGFECVELNAELLAQARKNAEQRGVSSHVDLIQGDFNRWTPTTMYDGVLANSSLHHVVNLEGLFDNIRRALLPTGIFVTSDTVGRNGHMRWPEALSLVHEYWRELPSRYRYNRQLNREEPIYENWDCSTEGFEGIRAQDILPLLIANFDFDLFVPFANIIDPFIDRCFGHNFSAAEPWDTGFIDRVHARDEAEILRGAIKPTHIVAAMCANRPGRNVGLAELTPKFCVRRSNEAPIAYRAIAAAHPRSADQTIDLYDVEIIPERPCALDRVVARVGSSRQPLRLRSLRLHNSTIRLIVDHSDESPGESPSALAVELGRYPVGRLSLEVIAAGKVQNAVAIDIHVRTDGRASPRVDYSDLWWDPSTPGWGLAIHQHTSGQLMANWLAHDADGRSSWYSLQPGRWLDETTFLATIFATYSERSGNVVACTAASLRSVGEASIRFQDPDRATLVYRVDEQVGEARMVRMRF